MSARTKLDVACFNGNLLVSAVFGWITESWAVFFAALALTIACWIYDDNIRPASSGR